MDIVKNLITNNIRKFGMVIALVGIIILFQILTNGILLTPLNITNIIMQNSYIIVLAIGMMLVIISGEIDLSVGSVAAFVGAIAGVLLVTLDLPVIVGIVLCLLIGALIGAWQGFWVSYVNIPSFIVTLAGMLIFRGLTLIVLDGRTIAPFPENFRSLSSSFIPNIFATETHFLTIIIGGILSLIYVLNEVRIRRANVKYNFETLSFPLFVSKIFFILIILNLFTFVLAQYAGIPYVLIILLLLIFGYTFVMNKTVIGRHIYALGGNINAAQLSGVKTKKMKFLVFVNMGVLAALSGLIFAGRLNAATPQAGNLFELDAIAAAVIGGASFTGGVGTIFGAVIGALVMGVLNNGMSLMGIGIDWQQAIKGMVLLGAVAFDVLNKNK
ncbi:MULTISPECIES: multiple monosaccharide ABC transporter permease [Oceanobacillus]|uniref:Xylose transport system permease protein XylH n=1 Tax=Oceanobacillus kimchii TaxID=746691 RepID=A0ABQ5TKM7_9BACI|nr:MULTISPECIES: multiple monosaccharide ABC transporter permease [Oceanobacillus]MBT2600795.1 sugar ABC transporter permease [Oceanobacillus sp. ISL-74]MBT2650808.1 sugar ABC transporter permease [Oceanobacillus sp. ISL-73]MCT1575550.1 sugar ABC transporter permease [Oceanobacillus kimchii]MCT2137181.1 sugar ABC transporter permease [Oceanobacillus kimchii]GLO66871.1 ABC transporter permease [Oceanobacillus kimchii]